jgi:hypothetical protein
MKHFSITNMNLKEIIAVYSEDHMKPINTLCGQNTELGDTYNYYNGL